MVRGGRVHASDESDGFLKSIRVIRLCQNVAGGSRVSVRGNTVSTRRTVQNIMLLCWICLASALYYLALTTNDIPANGFRGVAVNVCLSAFSLYMEAIIVVVTSKDAVRLANICQNIERNAPKLKQKSTFRDWLTYVTMFAILQFLMRGFTMARYIYTNNVRTLVTKFNFNSFVSYLSELDVLMWVKICDYLKSHLQNMNAVLREKSKSIYIHDFDRQKYLYLFERCTYGFVYALKLHKWTILFFYGNFLIWIITMFRAVIAAENVVEGEILLYTLVKKLMLVAVISYTTEMYKNVCDETGQTCYDILDNHDKGELKEFADVVLYLLHEMPPATQIGGVLHLDFKLFFQFLSQFISYTVIILQFSNFKSN